VNRRENLHAQLGTLPLEEVPSRLCEVGVAQLGVDGVGLALIADPQARSLLASSGSLVDELEQAQFDLGEGPCLDAQQTGEPSMEPDVRTSGRNRWPAFADAALDLGVAAVFSFPLKAGSAPFGVLDAARRTPGPLGIRQVEDALHLAELASEAVLMTQEITHQTDRSDLTTMTSQRLVVHQATGMVAAQATLSTADSLAWLRLRAYSSGRSLEDVSADVVVQRLSFGPP
jgi:hypothetical protein